MELKGGVSQDNRSVKRWGARAFRTITRVLAYAALAVMLAFSYYCVAGAMALDAYRTHARKGAVVHRAPSPRPPPRAFGTSTPEQAPARGEGTAASAQ